MLVSEFLTKLTNTTLRNLGLTKEVTDRELSAEYRVEIIDYINSGLLELYNKFQLKVDNLFIELREGRTRYPLTSEHVMKDWHDPDYDHYLWQEVNKSFLDDLIKVILIRDHSGFIVPLNNPNDKFSIITPEYNVIEIPSHFPVGVLAISYQCRHPAVSADTDEISLPDMLFDPLSYYVASHACSNMNSEGSIANANKYSQLYLSSIQALDTMGTLEPMHTPSHGKFYRGGWC